MMRIRLGFHNLDAFLAENAERMEANALLLVVPREVTVGTELDMSLHFAEELCSAQVKGRAVSVLPATTTGCTSVRVLLPRDQREWLMHQLYLIGQGLDPDQAARPAPLPEIDMSDLPALGDDGLLELSEADFVELGTGVFDDLVLPEGDETLHAGPAPLAQVRGEEADACDTPAATDDGVPPEEVERAREEAAELVQSLGGMDRLAVKFDRLKSSDQIKLARGGGRTARALVMRKASAVVWRFLISNPGLSRTEVADIAANGSAPREILERIFKNRTWMREEQVRLNLLHNPNTPVPISLRIVPTLPSKVLRRMHSSRTLPGAVESLIRRFIEARGE